MDVPPRISATPPTAFVSLERLEALRAMPYDDYLQTPEWRRRRDRSLSLAGWTCTRCDAQRTLRVHHRTYERRGQELDTDLEVLCQTCHEGLHVDEQRAALPGVFVSLVSDALKTETFTHMEDLVEAVKVLAAKAHIEYDAEKVWNAAKLVDANRHGIINAPRPTPHLAPSTEMLKYPIGREEAKSLCRRLGLKIPLRSMPAVERISHRDRDRQLAMAIVEQEMLESLRRCEALERAVKETT